MVAPFGTEARQSIVSICQRLRTRYGPIEPPPQEPVLDELIAVVLSQNTSDVNSKSAFGELRRRFRSWDDVRRASVARIVRAIQRGGLAMQKAPRIKAILQTIYTERGDLSLDFLCDTPTLEAIDYLRRFQGVGPKTVGCVLLFACRKPVLPVDTHVLRVSARLGLIGHQVNAVLAHELLARLVPRRLVLDFHMLFIRHGRALCTARRPACEKCPLLELCPEGHRRLREAL
jgi:endonuclease III